MRSSLMIKVCRFETVPNVPAQQPLSELKLSKSRPVSSIAPHSRTRPNFHAETENTTLFTGGRSEPAPPRPIPARLSGYHGSSCHPVTTRVPPCFALGVESRNFGSADAPSKRHPARLHASIIHSFSLKKKYPRHLRYRVSTASLQKRATFCLTFVGCRRSFSCRAAAYCSNP